jgi:hypothetical protein
METINKYKRFFSEKHAARSVSKTPVAKLKLILFSHSKKIFGSHSTKSLEDDPKIIEEKELKHEKSLKFIDIRANKSFYSKKLGPGSYSLISLKHADPCSFSSLPRFSANIEDKFLIRKDKSPTQDQISINKRINNNKNLLSRTPESRKNYKISTKKSKQTSIKISQKTKGLILSGIIANKQKCLELKNKQIEKNLEKLPKIKYLKYLKAWMNLLVLFGSFTAIGHKFSQRVYTKNKANKLLSLLFFVSKAIGKFKIATRKLNKIQAIAILSQNLTQIIKHKKLKITKKHFQFISFLFDRVLQSYEIKCIIDAWKHKIISIQIAIKSFLEIRKARIRALGLLWDKLKPKIKAPIFLKIFFLRTYIKQITQKYLKSTLKNQKLSSQSLKNSDYSSIHKLNLFIYSKPAELILYITQLEKKLEKPEKEINKKSNRK